VPDVVVVGAGCAGAPTAMLLARRGYRVLLLDRARFPRDTLSTHYLQQPGVALLRDWKLLEAVLATGCPPLGQVRYRAGDATLGGPAWRYDGVGFAVAPRRYLLDRLLVDAAIAAGVEFRDGQRVTDLLTEDGRVVGVRCRTADGRPVDERARLVVGADGMRSRVAARAGAVTRITDPLMTCVYYTYWPGIADRSDGSDRFEIYEAPGRWVGVVPTNDGLTLVAAYFPQAEYDRVRADATGAYLDAIRGTAPDVYERVRSAERAERLHGTGAQHNFFRQAVGPGWALVGDAGHHKDSLTARGITDAFHQAALLADGIGTDLDHPHRLRAALLRYERRRDDLLMDEYLTTLSMARLALSGERLARLRAAAGDPERTGRFLRSLCGEPFQDRMRPP
jgi:2-polyprenyl-6-methoxyphenol hydroxylase-like FAD-dependent oxidoreductase